MAIDIYEETIIDLTDVRGHVPGPRKQSLATAFRWWRIGIRLPGSKLRIKLETVKIAGRRCSSVEAVRRFLHAANDKEGAMTVTPAQRRTQAETANRLLQEAGL